MTTLRGELRSLDRDVGYRSTIAEAKQPKYPPAQQLYLLRVKRVEQQRFVDATLLCRDLFEHMALCYMANLGHILANHRSHSPGLEDAMFGMISVRVYVLFYLYYIYSNWILSFKCQVTLPYVIFKYFSKSVFENGTPSRLSLCQTWDGWNVLPCHSQLSQIATELANCEKDFWWEWLWFFNHSCRHRKPVKISFEGMGMSCLSGWIWCFLVTRNAKGDGPV